MEKKNIVDFLKYSKKNFRREKDNLNSDEESTIEETIIKILKIKEITKRVESGIKYELEF